jgi:hypothetical protein
VGGSSIIVKQFKETTPEGSVFTQPGLKQFARRSIYQGMSEEIFAEFFALREFLQLMHVMGKN